MEELDISPWRVMGWTLLPPSGAYQAMTAIPGTETLEGKVQRASDMRRELDRLEGKIAELKVLYEQFFTGVLPLAPEKLHAEVRLAIRRMRKTPFRNSETNFRLNALEQRYQTFNSYFMRVLRQREEGTYSRDVFKAELRARQQQEQEHSQTKEGRADGAMRALFDAYKGALEEQSGRAQKIDYQVFRKALVAQTKSMREQLGTKKLSFHVMVKNGRVSIEARPGE